MSALPIELATGEPSGETIRKPSGERQGEALTFDALCALLVERGINLNASAVRAGRLTVDAPAGAVTPAIAQALALHRAALLAALTAPRPAGPLPAHPQCAWGKPHYQAWDYHAGWRTLICAICYPQAWDVPPMPPTPPAEAWPDWPASDAASDAASMGASVPTLPGTARQRPTPTPQATPDDPPGAPAVKPSPRGGSSRAADRGPDRLAVLDASGDTVCVWVERPHTVGAPTVERVRLAPEDAPTPGACNAGALLALAARLQVSQLWVHPSWARLAGLPMREAMPKWRDERRAGVALPFISDALADGWDIQPAGLAPWMVGLRRGVWGRYALVYPEWDYTAPWRNAPDGETLLRALVRYRSALGGHAYRYTPAVTGVALLKRLHSGRTALDLAASMTPGDFPPPAREPGTEWDMSYERPLTPDEVRRSHISACDKNAQYLGAVSSLWVGMGKAEHLTASGEASGEGNGETSSELARLVALAATKDRLPGYWLASIAYDPPAGLPSPFTPDGVPAAPDAAPRWLTTPTLELALKVGARVDVREAWVWRERHRPLEPFYQVMRDAREALMGEASGEALQHQAQHQASALALAVVKATYRATLGGRFDATWLRASTEPEDLYRPDWRHAVIAQARANFYRAALAVYKASGLAPIRAVTDCWYYPVEAPDSDALAACPAPLKRGDGLAGWKVKVTPLADYLAQAPASAGPRKRSDILAELAHKRAEGK